MTSRLCSMTTTVLPVDRRAAAARRAACGCRRSAARSWARRACRAFAGRAPAQLRGELDALGLAAGQRGRGLAELDIAEPDVVQRLQRAARSAGCSRRSRSASSTLIARTSAIVLALVRDLERLAVVPRDRCRPRTSRRRRAGSASRSDLTPSPCARLAAAARDVEREPARRRTADAAPRVSARRACGRRRRRRCTWRGSSAACDRSATGRCRSPCRSSSQPVRRLCLPGGAASPDTRCAGARQRVLDERGLARAADAGDTDEQTERDLDRHIL